MKNVVIVVDHPYTATAWENEPHNRSFTAALAHQAVEAYQARGYHVDVIDLHVENFDPVMHAEDLVAWRQKEPINEQIRIYQAKILNAHELVFVFPIWWETMPAMMKGFFDKVFAKGIVYIEDQHTHLFKHQFTQLERVHLLTTMATPNLLYRVIFGSPVVKSIFRGTFHKMGIHQLKWQNYAAVASQPTNRREKLLANVKNKLK
ncbi:NAD(P)H dehydrogenase [Periweissella cryptocerci]|uniref:NAD(P)H dehydrogenase n=1 Tax=Periweissella cryptocerci TaxID=2506420 RepID=A0A4P6YVH9_9LACO|nr:NAD(P)H-dependent oxidoreductase [Periweissella cryptocerci]QBO36859.1 NAD(P)H dehydrogenase [Periweissella cryptocerci]